jgi:hypothetical protein
MSLSNSILSLHCCVFIQHFQILNIANGLVCTLMAWDYGANNLARLGIAAGQAKPVAKVVTTLWDGISAARAKTISH